MPQERTQAGRPPWPRPVPVSAKRCECTGYPFEDLARRIREEGLTLEEVSKRTGVGQLCTACIPDLVAFLRAR